MGLVTVSDERNTYSKQHGEEERARERDVCLHLKKHVHPPTRKMPSAPQV
jgi:hypothetical protein